MKLQKLMYLLLQGWCALVVGGFVLLAGLGCVVLFVVLLPEVMAYLGAMFVVALIITGATLWYKRGQERSREACPTE